MGGANRAASAAAEAVQTMTAHCAECADLVLREEGMVRALAQLVDPAKANSK
jgi:hypothetical protein